MSEFVECQLERLIPAFEGLKRSNLFSDAELVNLKENFRRFEYSITKRTKELRDYYEYAEYIANLIADLHCRRQKKCNYKYTTTVDKALKYKGADLHRMAEERFKSENVFRREIEYLRVYRLGGLLSEAFTRRLQLYGANPRYHEEAGRFEFFENKSAENARFVLHSALRRFSMDVGLWLALFEIEINYMKIVRKRIIRLQGHGDNPAAKKRKHDSSDHSDSGIDDEKTVQIPDGDTDAVLNLKLAQIVYTHAREKLASSVVTEIEFMYKAWRITAAKGELSSGLEKIIYDDLAAMSPPPEEFVLAQCQRDEKLLSYDLYDAALAKMQTEKMCRLYIAFCEKRREKDVFASIKLAELLSVLDNLSVATAADYERLLELFGDNDHVLCNVLDKMPQNVSVWKRLIALRIRNFLKDNENPSEEQLEFAEIKKLVDEALQKVDVEKSLEIWSQFLELACAVFSSSKKLNKLFARAFRETSPKIAAELRVIRLSYLVEGCLDAVDNGDQSAKLECLKALRSAYNDMAKVRPSSVRMHMKYIEVEEQMDHPDVELIRGAMENMVNEFGGSSVDVWLKYLKFHLKHLPNKIGLLHKRALVNLDASIVDSFNEKWTLAMLNLDL